MSIEKILVPDVGGEEVEIIEICFAVGDAIEADEGIVTVETDKASMDIPAPFAGTLASLTVAIGDKIKEGDVIVGFESFGQAAYEKEYNGGMGSNGLTSARHDVFHKYLASTYPESFDASMPEELVYSGKVKLNDAVENSPIDAGKLILSPTRTYAPIIKSILSKYKNDKVHGMIHCSGGAQTKILHFVDNLHIIKDNMFAIPPLFKLIQEQSKTDWKINICI